MLGCNGRAALPGCQSAGGTQHDQVGAHAVDLGGNALPGHGFMHGIAPGQLRRILTAGAGLLQACAYFLLLRGMGLGKALGVQVKAQPGLDDAAAQLRILGIVQLHAQA